MADKEVPPPTTEKLEHTEKGEREQVQSDESGQATDTDKSSESYRSPDTSSGIELKFEPGSSEPEATSPESATGVAKAVSHSKSPFKSALKCITVGTSKIIRKISPKKHKHRERSKSPEKLAPEGEVESLMTGEQKLADEIRSKSAREYVDPEVACKHPDSETTDENITIAAEQRRERFTHKLPNSAEIGKWTPVRMTVDTDRSSTTDQSVAESTDDFSESEVFTTTRRMSKNLGLSEQEEKRECISETVSETEKKNIPVSLRKTPIKRQMAVESSQEEEMDSPSLSKRLTLQKDESEESID